MLVVELIGIKLFLWGIYYEVFEAITIASSDGGFLFS